HLRSSQIRNCQPVSDPPRALLKYSPSAVHRSLESDRTPPGRIQAPLPCRRATAASRTVAEQPQTRRGAPYCTWQSRPPEHSIATPHRNRPRRERSVLIRVAMAKQLSLHSHEEPSTAAKEKSRSPAIRRNHCACKQSTRRKDSRQSTRR